MLLANVSSYALGLVFIVLVAVIWSIASIVVQYLYAQSFDAPFLLTYIGTSLFVVQLPLHWLYKRWEIWRSSCGDRSNSDYETIPPRDETLPENWDEEGERQESLSIDFDNQSSNINNNNNNNNNEESSSSANESEKHWTEKDHIIAAIKLSPFWFVSNYAYNASLEHTSITSSTVLVNTGSLFTFLIALLMQDERFSCWKLFGVLFGMTGCILTARHDAREGGGDGEGRRMRFLFGGTIDDYDNNGGIDTSDDDSNDLHFWGDILSVVSAAFYGIYVVMIRVLCPRDESLMSMQLFLGYVGFWNMLVLSPIAIYQLGIAKSVTLSSWVFGCIVINGLFNNVISDYLWARSVVLTSATVATVGLGLTIPLAFASDVFLGSKDVLNSESILGAVFVLFGFVFVNIGQTQDDIKDANDESRRSRIGEEGLQTISMQAVSS
mmetsp:Transcript_13435/g.28155  ORF Transcript_13435/g.28155 Transcript_13435/m.28155 type:complete len:438 (-) Transcript_13435:420-1733(-)